MPLALDLISTLVMGSIFPVATTLLARSPFSTLASFEGSILVPLLDAINTPVTTRARTPAAIELQIMIRLRRFFLPLPLPSTTASCLISSLRPGIHLLLRENHRNSSSKILAFVFGRRFSNANVETGLAPSHSAALHALRPPDNEKESERLGCT